MANGAAGRSGAWRGEGLERGTDIRRGGPSVAAIVFLLWLVAIPAFFAGRLLNTDGDLASHIFLGRRVLEHGPVVPVDWAFTAPGAVFVAYEWLSEVLLAGGESVLGLPGIAALGTLLIAGAVALVASYLSRHLEPFLVLPAAMGVAVLTAARWSARPHLFTLFSLAALLWLATSRRRWRTPAIGVLFALWANLHPAFLYGLVIYLAYLAGEVLDERSGRALRGGAIAAATAGLATLLNPLGWGLHGAVLEHLRDREAFRMVDEFLPPSPGTVQGALFFATLALLAWLAVRARRLPPWSALLPLALAIAGAFVSARNVALLALFALPLTLRHLLEPRTGEPTFAAEFRARLRADEARASTGPWIAGGAGALGVAALVSAVGLAPLLPRAFSGDVFPAAAVAHARARGMTGRPFFHEYTWGGYLLYAWPGQPIYIDGMANLFGSDLMLEYAALYEAAEGWQRVLDDRGIEAILLPPDSPLIRAAGSEDRWRVEHRSDTAVLLTRAAG